MAARRVVQPREQREQRRLARAGPADECDELPAFDGQRDVSEDRFVAPLVGERDAVERHRLDRLCDRFPLDALAIRR
ncbi:hypothetical protein [Salinigranum rubrum]|uniref:hypothetical protein n=1 Tax=Salinigranum rubrum TaxID=755307 RepID=UPI002AA2A1F6|nr:hypothetical protein [Salinigranum rubrum]